MTKIVRKTAVIFGGNAPAAATGIAEFGSLANGTPNFSTDPAVIQSLPQWLGGWSPAVIGPVSPALEDMNAVNYVASYQIAYLLQQGVPEYDSATTYFMNGFCSYLGQIYISLVDNNTGNTPATSATKWKTLSAGSVWGGTDTGTPSNYIISTVSFGSLFVGLTIYFIPTNENLGDSTLVANGSASHAILDSQGNPLIGGEIQPFRLVTVVWDGFNWRIPYIGIHTYLTGLDYGRWFLVNPSANGGLNTIGTEVLAVNGTGGSLVNGSDTDGMAAALQATSGNGNACYTTPVANNFVMPTSLEFTAVIKVVNTHMGVFKIGFVSTVRDSLPNPWSNQNGFGVEITPGAGTFQCTFFCNNNNAVPASVNFSSVYTINTLLYIRVSFSAGTFTCTINSPVSKAILTGTSETHTLNTKVPTFGAMMRLYLDESSANDGNSALVNVYSITVKYP